MEKLLQYAWHHKFYRRHLLRTSDGEKVDVIDPGWLNNGAGPDFFNAKIKIGEKIWAGNVEIHVKASDWYRHGHQNDPAYDSVIMHVVGNDDMIIKRSNGNVIPQIVIDCGDNLSGFYNEMLRAGTLDLVCASYIADIPKVEFNSWIDALAYERMYEKSGRINAYLSSTGGDWRQALFIALARGLGFSRNSASLERLAMSVPLSVIGKHADSPIAVRAILIGQAGLIESVTDATYRTALENEYAFMSHKFSLSRPEGLMWGDGGTRPQNSPLRRLEMLASYVEGGFSLLSKMREAQNASALRNLFIPATGSLSRQMIDSLVINVAVPALFAFAMTRGDDEGMNRALEMLREIPAENNSIIRIFRNAGIVCDSAYASQALICLRHAYCECRQCLVCRVGHAYLRRKLL